MNPRTTLARPGRHVGWWAEGRWSNGRLFMMTWWPTEGLARGVARLFASADQPSRESQPRK